MNRLVNVLAFAVVVCAACLLAIVADRRLNPPPPPAKPLSAVFVCGPQPEVSAFGMSWSCTDRVTVTIVPAGVGGVR